MNSGSGSEGGSGGSSQWGKPPPGYVPGVGRGAVGFSSGVSRDVVPRGNARDVETDGDQSRRFPTTLDADDKFAELTYERVDEYLRARRGERKRKATAANANANANANADADANANANANRIVLPAEAWDSLTDIGNTSLRRKQVRQERYVPNLASKPKTARPSPRDKSKRKEKEKDKDNDRVGVWKSSTTNPQGVSRTGLSSTQEPSDAVLDQHASEALSLTAARDAALGATLDRLSAPTSELDFEDYLKALTTENTAWAETDEDRRQRAILKSLALRAGASADTWLSFARAEFKAGKNTKAATIIAEACRRFPKEGRLWLEAARIATTPEEGDAWLALACKKHLARSPNLWLARLPLQPTNAARRSVLAEALDANPRNLKLWQEMLKTEEDQSTRKRTLQRAVSKLPNEPTLWLEVAALSDTDLERMKVLNEARRQCPHAQSVWLAAAHFEERRLRKSQENITQSPSAAAENNALEEENKSATKGVERIIGMAFRKLPESLCTEAQWVEAAIASDAEDLGYTATAIVRQLWAKASARPLGPPDPLIAAKGPSQTATEEKKEGKVCGPNGGKEMPIENSVETLAERGVRLMKQMLNEHAIATAHAFFQTALNDLASEEAFWIELFAALRDCVLPGDRKTTELVSDVCANAVLAFPHHLKVLGLVRSTAQTLAAGYVKRLCTVIEDHLEGCAMEAFSLATHQMMSDFLIECAIDAGEFSGAKRLCGTARRRGWDTAFVARIMIKIMRKEGDLTAALTACRAAVVESPSDASLHALEASLREARGDAESEVIQSLERASRTCQSGMLMTGLIRRLMKREAGAQARATYERALSSLRARMLRLEKEERVDRLEEEEDYEQIVRAAVLCERIKSPDVARNLVHKALEQLPTSGKLWLLATELEPPASRGAKVLAGLEATDSHPAVSVAAALHFWKEDKLAKAAEWFHRAFTSAPDNGDVIAPYVAFLIETCRSSGSQSEYRRRIELLSANARTGYGWKWFVMENELEKKSQKSLMIEYATLWLREDEQTLFTPNEPLGKKPRYN